MLRHSRRCPQINALLRRLPSSVHAMAAGRGYTATFLAPRLASKAQIEDGMGKLYQRAFDAIQLKHRAGQTE